MLFVTEFKQDYSFFRIISFLQKFSYKKGFLQIFLRNQIRQNLEKHKWKCPYVISQSVATLATKSENDEIIWPDWK